MAPSFTTILRALGRQKSYTTLNFIGLFVSITVAILIGVLLVHERSFDNFHRQPESIYRVVCHLQLDVTEEKLPLAASPVGHALRHDIGGIQDLTTVSWEERSIVHLPGGQIIQEDNLVYADSAFFDVFHFPNNLSNAAQLLRQPNKVLLTQKTADRYFPGGNALGKTIKLGDVDQQVVEVAGVLPDPPANSHLPYSMLVSWPTLQLSEDELQNWGFFSHGRFVYLRVPPSVSPDAIGEKLSSIAEARKDKRDSGKYQYQLQPLADIHTNPVYADFNATYTPDVQQFYWLGAIALFLLLVACINYINLSTAIAARKAREVGVRKTLGASRAQLATHFLTQTLVVTCSATALALGSVYYLIPELNTYLDRNIQMQWFSPEVLGLAGAICLGATLLAGAYPAALLAGLSPVEAFRNKWNPGGKHASLTLRRSLVTFQFVIAQVFIAGVIVAALQMQYLREKPLGFASKNVLDIRLPDFNQTRNDAIKAEMAQIPGVRNISQSTGAPTSKWANVGTIFNLSEKFDAARIEVGVKICDHNYLETYDIALLAGRFITEADEKQCLESIPEASRRYVCVLNESAVKSLGFATPEAALGHKVTLGIDRVTPPIVGVVRDFHISSLHEPVGPVAMMPFHQMNRNLGIALEDGAANAKTLAAVEKVWKEFCPDMLFTSVFLDEHLASLYRTESRTFTLFQGVTFLALLLNALGLIGLTTFVVEQKTKEIGVRKVLGASVASITRLLTSDFLKLVCLAFLLASPLAYYGVKHWLADFAYRIDLQWWMFALSGVAAMLVAILTVSFQSIHAALANPVKSLRNE
jgi:hypothetical protein